MSMSVRSMVSSLLLPGASVVWVLPTRQHQPPATPVPARSVNLTEPGAVAGRGTVRLAKRLGGCGRPAWSVVRRCHQQDPDQHRRDAQELPQIERERGLECLLRFLQELD